MKYLYNLTNTEGEKFKTGFLETKKMPIKSKAKKMPLSMIDVDGKMKDMGETDGPPAFAPVMLKMDICTGITLGDRVKLQLYKTKDQRLMFTLTGFYTIVNHKTRVGKFIVTSGKLGVM